MAGAGGGRASASAVAAALARARVLHLYRGCLRSALRAVNRPKAEEMRLLCRYKFRDGVASSVGDRDRAAHLYAEGVRELSTFRYYLAMADSRRADSAALAAGAAVAPSAGTPQASPDEMARRLFAQLEEDARGSAERKLGVALPRIGGAGGPGALAGPGAPPPGPAAAPACAACGSPLGARAKFCGECGAKQ
jgi:hypothetical protein